MRTTQSVAALFVVAVGQASAHNLDYADANCHHPGVGFGVGPACLHADERVVDCNAAGTYGFQIPLASKHLVNGGPEVVPVTPPAGLRGFYVTNKTAPLGAKSSARYYRFSADPTRVRHGHEGDPRPLSLQAGARHRRTVRGLSRRPAWHERQSRLGVSYHG